VIPPWHVAGEWVYGPALDAPSGRRLVVLWTVRHELEPDRVQSVLTGVLAWKTKPAVALFSPRSAAVGFAVPWTRLQCIHPARVIAAPVPGSRIEEVTCRQERYVARERSAGELLTARVM
jgi:hypothetical protein